MRKSVFQILTAAVLLAFVTSCVPVAPSPSGTASPVPSAAEPTTAPSTAVAIPTPQEQTVVPTPTPAGPTPTPAPTLDFSKEPPLDEFSAYIAVPAFLTEEQQDLYRRAHCVYLNLFGVTTAFVDYMGDPRRQIGSSDTVVIDEMTYTFSYGRYRKWADFECEWKKKRQKSIEEIAEAGKCVIVGRASGYILRERENNLKVFIHAEDEKRIQRAIEKEGIKQSEAENALKKNDKRRGGFYNSVTNWVWSDPKYYEIYLNAGRLGIDLCVKLLAQAVRG